MLITGVKEKDYNSYVEDLIEAGFSQVMTSQFNGMISGSYMAGKNNISLTLNTSNDELMIGFTGNQ